MPAPPPPGYMVDPNDPTLAIPIPRPRLVPVPKMPTPQTPEQTELTRTRVGQVQAATTAAQAGADYTRARTEAILNPPPTARMRMEQKQQSRGALTVADGVRQMASNYLTLMRMGSAVNAEDPAGSRLLNTARGWMPGFVGNVVDPKAQRVRDIIQSGRPMLVNSIRRATGMGAKGMDSNQELKTYLQMVGDPRQDLVGNLARLDAIDRRYGTGGKALEGVVPPVLLGRVRKLSEGFGGQLPSPADIPPDPGTMRMAQGVKEVWDGTAWKPAQ